MSKLLNKRGLNQKIYAATNGLEESAHGFNATHFCTDMKRQHRMVGRETIPAVGAEGVPWWYIYMVIMLCHTDLLVILLRFEALVSNSLVSVEMFRTSTCHLLMWSANLLPPTLRPAIKCQRNRFREPYFWQTLYTILLHPAQVWPVTVHQDSLRKLPPSSRHHSEWPETFFCFSSWLPPKTKTTIWSKANEGSTYEGWGLCLPYAREKFEDLQITI